MLTIIYLAKLLLHFPYPSQLLLYPINAYKIYHTKKKTTPTGIKPTDISIPCGTWILKIIKPKAIRIRVPVVVIDDIITLPTKLFVKKEMKISSMGKVNLKTIFAAHKIIVIANKPINILGTHATTKSGNAIYYRTICGFIAHDHRCDNGSYMRNN